MLNELIKALFDLLKADATLIKYLSTYIGLPSIFTADAVPNDARLPYIAIALVSDTSVDTKDELGRDIWLDIGVWYDPRGTAVDINDAAERVRTLLHKKTITLASFELLSMTVSNIISVAVDPDYNGRIVSIRVYLEKK